MTAGAKAQDAGSASGGSGITQLTGDVVAGPGSGSQAATVDAINGVAVSANQATLVTQLSNISSLNTSALPATATAGTTILTGSTSGGTLTLPASPVTGSIVTIVNNSTVSVTVSGGSNSINYFGTVGSLTLPASGYVQLQFTSTGTTWDALDSNALTQSTGILPIANGGTNASSVSGALTNLGLTAASINFFNYFEPSFYGSTLAYSMPPDTVSGTATPTVGVAYYIAIPITSLFTANNISVAISTAGASLASSYLGIYNSSGTRLAVTGAITTAWQSSGVVATTALSSSYTFTSTGIYYIGLLVGSGSTTAPTFRGAGGSTPLVNLGQSTTANALSTRAQTLGTSLTALPSSISGTPAASSFAFFAAIS